ncbi:MAG: fluoride efflux transporter CrcB [Saprospiraceae bacterium]
MPFLLVFLGGGLGSLCRFGIGLAIQPLVPRFPLATLLANALACFVLGMLISWQQAHLLSDSKRLLLATGFCGGFSTFSTFTSESWHLFQAGQTAEAVLNIVLSLAIGVLCLLLGMKIT